jgi:hypothetical protein
MVCLMGYKHSSRVMDEIGAFILSIPHVDRCSNQEVEEWLNRFIFFLSVFDGVYSAARMSCGKVTEDIQNLIHTAMKLWRGLGISVGPKLQTIKDHLAEQIIKFSGIGYFCEDFIEKSH